MEIEVGIIPADAMNIGDIITFGQNRAKWIVTATGNGQRLRKKRFRSKGFCKHLRREKESLR